MFQYRNLGITFNYRNVKTQNTIVMYSEIAVERKKKKKKEGLEVCDRV